MYDRGSNYINPPLGPSAHSEKKFLSWNAYTNSNQSNVFAYYVGMIKYAMFENILRANLE